MQPAAETRALRPGLFLIVVVLISSATRLAAHDPGLSALTLVVERTAFVATLSLAEADAGKVRLDEVVAIDADGRRLIGSRDGSSLRFPRGAAAQLTVSSVALERLPRGHLQLLTIRTSDGRVLMERMLDATANTVVLDVSAIGDEESGAAARFFALGVAHIAAGYDHLLFLTAMLLTVGTFAHAAGIVTAFSAAHALSLVAASTGAITFPGDVVEPLIAASVVWVGVENIVRREVGARWLPAFGFGLVHGLGFAGALSELTAADAAASLAARLAFFNLGIEAGQLAFVALVLPVLWLARWSPRLFLRTQLAGSVAVACAGAYWMVERLG